MNNEENQLEKATKLLDQARDAQHTMWTALSEVEQMYGIEIDSTQDLDTFDLEEFLNIVISWGGTTRAGVPRGNKKS